MRCLLAALVLKFNVGCHLQPRPISSLGLPHQQPPRPSRCRAVASELQVEVRPVAGKGMGAFAAEPAQKGTWVCSYRGEALTLLETMRLYAEREPEYLFAITPDLYIDANLSTHFSRYFNHDEHGNLRHTVDVAGRRVDFFAARDIGVGEELTFNYGAGYWLASRKEPLPGTDSRDFSLPVERTSVSGHALPLTPRTADEMEALLHLPVEEARAGCMRTLEYYGATRRSGGVVEVPLGLGPTAERMVVDPEKASLGLLYEAAFACCRQSEQL
ncbi:hypothetical protein AB1Y20_004929 [Prymnesium parvum]|uniref:SET domain-containing protein n=1 Tax=Prymnesium parvum TaxID=97485 RepID=A0AB34J0M2_PRYPA